MFLWKFGELLLFANCWRANKISSASIVAGVFSLRNCGWLVERFFSCFPENVPGEQYVSCWLRSCSVAPVIKSWSQRLSFWTPATMSRRSFWPKFRNVWLPKIPASWWWSLWESSLFVPWFVLNAFRDITGVVPHLPWISGFMRKSSFTWVKQVGNVSLYRNYPQNIRSIRMYSVLYRESNFWWVFRNGSGNVP